MRALVALVAVVVLGAGCGRDVDEVEPRSPTTIDVAVLEAVSTGDPDATVVAAATVATVVARSVPDPDGAVVARFDHPVATGGPLVFQVLTPPADAVGAGWLEVLLPVRPNGTTGWIWAADVELTANPYRVSIDTSGHRLTIERSGEEVLATTIAIGTGDTPTPIGSFYLTELVQPTDPSGPYGSYAFGLSGFSETLQSFNGGQGVIGIHGTDNPASLGTEVSHGCVRVHNDTITEMASFLPLGTPVVIR